MTDAESPPVPPEHAPESPAAPEVVATTALRLHPGEQVILDILPSKWWTWPYYVLTIGLWALWRQRHHYVLTNQRVIRTRGIINKTEESAPLSRIQDARLQRSPLTGGKVEFTTAGTAAGLAIDKIERVTRDDALAFADALTPLIGTQ